jgi:hypothetical protein
MDFGGWVFTFDLGEDLAEVSDFYEGLDEVGGSLFFPIALLQWIMAQTAS